MTRTAASDEAAEARRSISAAASRLFISQGYDATTVEQIGREAGSSRATVFRYFGSKEDILFYRYDRALRELCAGVQDRKGSDSRRVRSVLLEVASRLESEGEGFRIELGLICDNPKLRARALVTLDASACLLARQLSADRSDGDLPARVLAHTGIAALQEAICMWHATDPGTRLVDLTDEALRLTLPSRRRS
jgi:AcrR family transcriptional regulator